MTVIITVENVSKRFSPRLSFGERIAARLGSPIETRTVHAVDGVSFAIRKGEVLGLVGESGCGKSTLGRVVAGIHPPSSGVASIDNDPVMNTDGRKTTTRIQMVFQDPFASLDPRIRIGETISEGPIAHNLVSRAEAKAYVARWLTAVGLPEEAAERFPHQFSGGQRQRVAIARALAMQPDVLVCDEPVASLDVSIQAQIINLFLKLRRELGLTMLFISHDLGIIRHISDRIAVMYLGRIVELGPTEAVYAAPQHPYTRALLDSVLTPEPGLGVPDVGLGDIMPDPANIPPGCRFHPRCPACFAPCAATKPRITSLEDGLVECHLAG